MFAARTAAHIKISATVHVNRCVVKNDGLSKTKTHNKSLNSCRNNALEILTQFQLRHVSSFSHKPSTTTITNEKENNMLDIFKKKQNNNNNHDNTDEQLQQEIFEAMKATNAIESHISLLVFMMLVALGWWSLDEANAVDANLPVTKVSDKEKAPIDALIKEGISFMNARKWNLALEAFGAAISMEPTNVVAHTFKAACHIEAGDYESAINECDIAQQNDKGILMPRIQFFKGIALALLTRHDEATECFLIATMHNPHEFPTAFWWMAKSFCAQSNFTSAYKAVITGLRYTDDFKLVRLHGMLLTTIERHREAIKAFDLVLEKHPKDLLAIISKGVALFALDDDKEAQKCFDQAIKIYPKCAMSLLQKIYAEDEVEMKIPKDLMYLELRELCG